MGYEGSWSGMRKYLEKEMLAESLKGRVRYGCTAYKGMDSCRIFEICIDDNYKKQFSWDTLYSDMLKKGSDDSSISWSSMRHYVDDNPVSLRDVHICEDFRNALADYRNQDIKVSFQSENPIVRMFAILDRRVGKRTLEKLKETLDEQPEWLKQFYILRFEAENM